MSSEITPLKIVFMGTPDFAVASLDRLNQSDHDVVAVVTAPDRPAGRGKKLRQSAVKEYAVQNQLPVLQPEKLRDPHFIKDLEECAADLYVVVAFRMLPEIVWRIPTKGTINLHGSLLPQYRGAAPINWAIINGEKETGVTTFFINENIDTGEILLQEKITIDLMDNAGSLHDKMMETGANLLLKTVNALSRNELNPVSQSEIILGDDLRHAPKIFKADCKIDWNQKAETVQDFIRGLSPYPSSWTSYRGKVVKIYNTRIEDINLNPGEILVRGKDEILVGTSSKSISIRELQMEGKKRMKSADFLRGFSFNEGDTFQM